MKQNPDFLLKDVAGALVIVPVGAAAASFPGMVTLNATGAYIWELLATEQTMESLVQALVDRYEVDADKAREDAQVFVQKLIPTGAILED